MDATLLILLLPLVKILVVAVVGYLVIRRAVRDGILDARRLEREDPAVTATHAWRRWQR